MKDLAKNYRFVVKPVPKDVGRSLDLARPMKIHPLTYQELPLNPEYTNYADGRFTLEKLSNACVAIFITGSASLVSLYFSINCSTCSFDSLMS